MLFSQFLVTVNLINFYIILLFEICKNILLINDFNEDSYCLEIQANNNGLSIKRNQYDFSFICIVSSQ